MQVPWSWPTRQHCGTSPALCRMLKRSWRCRPSRYVETWVLKTFMHQRLLVSLSVFLWSGSVFPYWYKTTPWEIPSACANIYTYFVFASVCTYMHPCCTCSVGSMWVQSKRGKVKSAMRLRRMKEWRPRQELKSWLHLHPPQVTLLV